MKNGLEIKPTNDRGGEVNRNQWIEQMETIRKKGAAPAESEVEKLRRELAELRKAFEEQTERNRQARIASERNEKMLQALVEAAAGKIGQDFFDNIIIRLSEWLNAECVLIGRMIENERIEAVPLYLDGEISHGFSYDLAGSPCDITTRKGYCTYTENVIEMFPKDKILVDLNAESYIGTALYNKQGETNGVICAVSRKKMEVPPYAHNILKIIGARVTAEIERQKTELALIKSEQQLRESNATKDKFFSIIAHDLKNPLNVLTGFSTLLMKKFDAYDVEKQKKYIQCIYDAANNTSNLVKNLLTWSMSQRRMIDCRKEPLSLHDAIADTLELAREMAAGKSIRITAEIPPGIYVNADENMLQTIVRNLLSNAVKFTGMGGAIRFYISETSSAGPGQLTLVVEDNGVGMNESQVASLFRVESTAKSYGTEDEEGTGLGLLLCREFIEMMNGSIWVESEVNKGSRFSFTLEKSV